jgi:NADPH2:quinone reductase
MRRVRYHRHGGPDVLEIEEVPVPEPGPGQVRIRMDTIGTSWVDTLMRRGKNPFGPSTLPGSPHGDVVGTVVAIGPGVDAKLHGSRVAALVAADAYADESLADVDWLVRVPDGVSAADASILDMPAPVAALALYVGRLAAGETVLVHAAAGGIGHLLTQLARARGARVIGTTGSPEKQDFVLAHGADVAVSTGDAGWTDRIRAAAPGGVDVVLDSVGGPISSASLELLAPLGRHVLFGAADGLPQISFPALLPLRTVSAFGLLPFRAARPAEARAQLDEVVEHVAAGRLRTAVHAVIPLAEVAKAHEVLESRDRLGRVLLVP